MTDSQAVDLAIDAFFNEPYNQPSRSALAERHDLPDDEVRRVIGDDNWVLIRRMIFEEAVRTRLSAVQANLGKQAEKPPAQKKETDGD